ncbi:hypothetical protein HPB51_024833 [Rhipicephalus microplus]|uniref:Uncharacterized protein n=1 Tax=Rhipicephalus microplus TaxID=6941 RepID=A0A9J6EQ84_RHIMP|nr:hypothetical protein HPB51_024833 [Rhipicephalus microplus]
MDGRIDAAVPYRSSEPVDVRKLLECAEWLLVPTTQEVKLTTIDKCKFSCRSVLLSQNSDFMDFHEIESLFVTSGRLSILTRTLTQAHGLASVYLRLSESTHESVFNKDLDVYVDIDDDFVIPDKASLLTKETLKKR